MLNGTPTVLVVEDEAMLLEAVSKKLELNGIQPVSCTSGEQALDYLKNLPQKPNAVWLDYHLSGMDGLAFMGKLKENPEWADIPVLVVSNSASEDKVHSMLALGAKQYLVKAEHRLDDLVGQVKQFIQTNA